MNMEAQAGRTARGNWGSWLEFFLTGMGYMIGLGNVWRFPYLCYKNGGGAFLLPYMLFLTILCAPCLFLIMSYSQFCGRGPAKNYDFCPLLKGIGQGCLIFISFVGIYYNVILSWALYYLGSSFKSPLPWSSCNNPWNTPLCYDRFAVSPPSNVTNVTGIQVFNASLEQPTHANTGSRTQKRMTPSEEFWSNEVHQMTGGIEDLGGLRWELALCLLCAWIIVFFINFKGVRSIGKVVYVTATLPILMMLVLLVRGALLPGAIDGVKYFLVPRWSELTKLEIWRDAAVQVFYSAAIAGGTIETMASYSKFNNNVLRDSILLTIGDAFASLLAGFVVFVILGFMSFSTGTPIEDVVAQGPGIAFMTYPEALVQLPLPQLWSVLFFIMLFTLGIDSQIAHIHMLTTAVSDYAPNLMKREKLFLLAFCLGEFLLGLPMVTQGGVYVLQIVDWYVASFTLLVISILQCISLCWIYGTDQLYKDIEMMLGHKPGGIWKIFWKFICPLITLMLLIFSVYSHKPVKYGDITYPNWSIGVGWIIALVSLIPIPVNAIWQLVKRKGSFIHRLRGALKPEPSWGPALPEYNEEYRMNLQGSRDSDDDFDTEKL